MASSASDPGIVNVAFDSAADTVSSAGSRTVRNLDHRLTLLSVRMTIVSLSFFFACFYFAQIYLQLINQNNLWLPSGVNHPSSAYGILETGFVLGAGLAYFWAQWAGLYTRNFARLKLGLGLAALLFVLAFVVHIAELHSPGFSLQAGGYASVFIVTEGVFTFVLGVGALLLLGVANRARLGLFNRDGVTIEAFGEFIGWVSAIAAINFLALYVQPFFPIA